MRVVVVAALTEEVAHLPDHVEVVVTGVGKARAAVALAKRLAADPRPDLVVNVGTAGAVDDTVSGLVEVDYVTQHDFPYDAIEALVGSDVDRGFALAPTAAPRPVHGCPEGARALATGDVFVSDLATAARIAAAGAHLVDMEAFAYAAACAEFGVPFRCVKVVSDSADGEAGESWLDTIEHCARALGDWASRHLPAG